MEEKTRIELWEGFFVEFDEKAARDFDFQKNLMDAQRENNIGEMVALYMDVVGGQETHDKIREHIRGDNDGVFDTNTLLSILHKIDDAFPKVGSRASRRSTRTLR